MPMTREERLAYQRGYNKGSRRAWPEHRPPAPPLDVVAKIMAAAVALRDAVDDQLAMLGEEDEWNETFGSLIDDVDASMIAVGEWIKSGETGDG